MTRRVRRAALTGRLLIGVLQLWLLPGLCARAAAQTPIFRAEVDAVEVDVAVMRGGQPVRGLRPDQFRLTDNGTPQTVQVTPLADLPLHIVLALDTSSSVRGERLERLITAGLGLAEALRPDDQIALVTFGHDVRMPVLMSPPGEPLRRALSALGGGGPTALRDAVQLSFGLHAARKSRALVLLFSDGTDTASWTTNEALADAARRTNSVLQVVRFDVIPDSRPTYLDGLALTTGGRTWAATSDADLEKLFTRALNEMRARYLLTYTPSGEQKKGWHDIRVDVRNARGDVTARRGYVVP